MQVKKETTKITITATIIPSNYKIQSTSCRGDGNIFVRAFAVPTAAHVTMLTTVESKVDS